jgi:predicted ArsR family transcriptional regulator
MHSHNLVTSKRGKTGRTALSLEDEQRIMARIAGGETKQAIADDLGIHRNTVKNIYDRLVEMGIAPASEPGAGQGTQIESRPDSTPKRRATDRAVGE